MQFAQCRDLMQYITLGGGRYSSDESMFGRKGLPDHQRRSRYGYRAGREFADVGYTGAMLARTAGRLDALAGEFDNARPYACDVGDAAALRSVFDRIKAELGAPTVVVRNAAGGERGTYQPSSPRLQIGTCSTPP